MRDRRAARAGGRTAARHGVRALLPALLAALATATACGSGDAHEPPPEARDARLQAVRDSAPGDSAALATLPPSLQTVLRLEPYLTDAHLARTPDAECRTLGDSLPDVLVRERRVVRLRLPDSSALVVATYAEPEGAALRRVEVVRREIGGEQRGFTWDGDDDRTLEVRWPEGVFGRPEAAPQPRGGPVPRALRAIGRRVLLLECDGGAGERREGGVPTVVP